MFPSDRCEAGPHQKGHGPQLGTICKGGSHQKPAFTGKAEHCPTRGQLVTSSNRLGNVAAGIARSWMRSCVVLIAASVKRVNCPIQR